MARRLWLSGFVVLSVLSACVAKPGVGPIRPSASTPLPPKKASPDVLGVASPDPVLATGLGRLKAPATGTIQVSGTVLIDQAYAVSTGDARVVANNGGRLVLPMALTGASGDALLSAGVGNLIANNGGNVLVSDGASIISDHGGGLISDAGGGIVSDNGGGLIAGRYQLAATADGLAPGTEGPAAGMLLRVIGLKDNRPIPLGVDDQNRPVYVVLTDKQGHYDIHLPSALSGNVRIVASLPGSRDHRLTYQYVSAPQLKRTAQHDEASALSTRSTRQALVSRLSVITGEIANDEVTAEEAVAFDPLVGPSGLVLIQDMLKVAEAAGMSRLPLARKVRVVQRLADHVVATLDLAAIPMLAIDGYTPAADERAYGRLTAVFAEIATRAADLMAREDLNQRPYIIAANARRKASGEPLVVIRKPSDLVTFTTEEYLAAGGFRARLVQVVLADLGMRPEDYPALEAAYNSIYIALGQHLFEDDARIAALNEGLKLAIAEELSPNAPALPPVDPAPPSVTAAPTPMTEAYEVTTLVGSAGGGYADGPAATAMLSDPRGLALGPDGALYVADSSNHAIRRIDLKDPTHPVTTVAGQRKGAEDGPVATAGLGNRLTRLALDATATPPLLYVVDGGNRAVRRLTLPPGQPGVLSTWLTFDGKAKDIAGLALDGQGGMWVSDVGERTLYRYNATGQTRSVVVSGDALLRPAGQGLGLFRGAHGVVPAPNGDVYLVDGQYHAVFRLRSGALSLVAGGGLRVTADGFFCEAGFGIPMGGALAPDGSLIVVDHEAHAIRRIRFDAATGVGVVSTLAGSGPLGVALGGFSDGPGATARFNQPFEVLVGPDGTIYVADSGNFRIRMLKPR